MKKFQLEIKPAVPIELRHKIAKLLEDEGYNVYGQGQFTNGSVCDIVFETTAKPMEVFKIPLRNLRSKSGQN